MEKPQWLKPPTANVRKSAKMGLSVPIVCYAHSIGKLYYNEFKANSNHGAICFIENLFEENKIEKVQYDIIEKWCEFAENNFKIEPHLIIYLRTTPGIAFERAFKRKRPEELQLPIRLFQRLHDYHENWLFKINKYPVLILDGNRNITSIQSEYEKCVKNLNINTSVFEDE